MLREYLPQRPLGYAVAPLALQRQAPRELGHPVIQYRHSGLDAHGHGGPIHLVQYVVDQVGA